MARSDKQKTTTKRSTAAPASAIRRAQVAERDAKFIEYIKTPEVQEKMNTLKPSKRMGYLIKSFKEETGIVIPTTMAYRAWHKSCGAIKTNKNGMIKFPSDSASDGEQMEVPVIAQWEDDEPQTQQEAENTISEETLTII